MTCPHCGADASSGQKFCPKCSRLIDSPLLKVKQQIDAAREEIRKDLHAAKLSLKSAAPPPLQQQYQVRVQSLGHAEASSYQYAPHPSQTPGLTPPRQPEPVRETIQRALNKRERKKKQRDEGITRATHTSTTHRFDPFEATKKATEEAKAAAKAAAEAGPAPEQFKRPASFSVLALLDLFAGMALLFNALRLTTTYAEPRPPIIELYRMLAGGAGLLFLLTMWGMLKLHPFGRFFQRLTLLPVLLWVPFGSMYAVATWFYLGSTAVRLYFSGRSPRSLNAKEMASWRSHEKIAPAMAFLLFVFGIIPGLAYATFIGSLLPTVLTEASNQFPQVFGQLAAGGAGDQAPVEAGAGGAAEPAPTGDPASVAVAEIRTLQRAQAVYSGLNEGYYDRLECVLAPATCIRNGDGRNNAVLLPQRFKEVERNDFVYTLYLFGAPAVRSVTASSTSMRGYAYRAVPTGGVGTAYCGDESGNVCSYDAQTFASDRGNGGRCPNVCDLVQP